MKITTYQITYDLTLQNRKETHTTRVKNCQSALHAKVKLHDYLQREYPDFVAAIMVDVSEDLINQMFGI